MYLLLESKMTIFQDEIKDDIVDLHQVYLHIVLMVGNIPDLELLQHLSYIRHEDFLRPPSSSVTLRVQPLNSETGWTGELWLKTKFLILEN